MHHDSTTGRFATGPIPARITRACECCGASFTTFASNIKRGNGRFCSLACVRDAQLATLPERFWSRVRKTDGCWLWTGRLDSSGYAVIDVGGRTGRPQKASRVAWFLATGAWPVLDVLHHCDTPACVRFDHTYEGTDADNARDKVARERQQRGERVKNAKLTDAAVLAMRREWHAGGVMQKDLAIRYGVSRGVVSEVLSGKSWRHLPLIPS